jgi:cytidylate kinase
MAISVITIDGAAGTGKGAVAYALSRRLNWHYLESGILYRALAYVALQQQVSLQAESALLQIAALISTKLACSNKNGQLQISLEGQLVTEAIRAEAVGMAASQIGQFPAIRQALLQQQRSFLRAPGLVAEGRDMGSCVFPEAKLKIFLETNLAVRSQRRYQQLLQLGLPANLERIQEDLAKRDLQDRSRSVAPLVVPEGAIVLDNSTRSLEAVVAEILQLAASRGMGSM